MKTERVAECDLFANQGMTVRSNFEVTEPFAAAKAATSGIQTTANAAPGDRELLLGLHPSLELKPASCFPIMPSALQTSGLLLSL